jgi:kanamycin kinase
MKRTEFSFDFETVPINIRQHIKKGTIFDSSCSEHAKTLFVKGTDNAFLKISRRGSLEREYRMTTFLNGHNVASKIIAYESNSENDYLLTEAINGEDGVSGVHLEYPKKLAGVFGEYLRMLHSIPTEGCPYENRTSEMLDEQSDKEISPNIITNLKFFAKDNVIIHGDYCLPNIIMDNFSFKGFIDLGSGGVGDRHYDLYWGIWTLNYNLKSDQFKDLFLDAYGKDVIDLERFNWFIHFIEKTK